MTPTIFQSEIARQLREIYPAPVVVELEWRAITNIMGLYSPRIDVAVGPFSTVQRSINEYDELMDSSRSFIERLLCSHRENVRAYRVPDDQVEQALHFSNFNDLKLFNSNARCLMAIEIENQVTRKHLLGGAVNAAALGRLGLIVGWTPEKVKALVRLQAYWDFLRSVGKNTFRTENLIILSPAQLQEALDHFFAHRGHVNLP